MGDVFGSSSDSSGNGTTAKLPDSNGNVPANDPAKDNGTNWGGILNSGVGLIGGATNFLNKNRENDIAEERNDIARQSQLSPEAKAVAESTYMQNRRAVMSAIQNFYQKRGIPFPGSEGSDGSDSSIPASQSNNEQIAQGQNTPNGQQRAANNIGSVLQPNAQAALANRSSNQAAPSSPGSSVANTIQKGSAIVQVGKAIYDNAFQKAVDSGATQEQATQAGQQAATQQGFTASEVAGLGQGAMTTFNALTNKNASAGQKAIGVAQGANQMYGATGGSAAGPIGAGLRGASVLASGQGTARQRAVGAEQQVGLAAADMYTGGAASMVNGLARSWKPTAGILSKVDEIQGKTSPFAIAYSAADSKFGSSKGEDQQMSDAYRARMRDMGIIKVEPGQGHEAWNIYVPDKTGQLHAFDVGVDGKGGRGAHEFDLSKSYEADGKTASLQGVSTARVMGLADLISGGDNKQSSKWGGYFTNAVMNASQGDPDSARVATESLYRQFGFKDAASAIAGVNELVKAGKIDEQRAQVQIQNIQDTFGVSDQPRGNPAQEARPQADRENGKGAAPRDIRSILAGQNDAKNAVQLWRDRKENNQ